MRLPASGSRLAVALIALLAALVPAEAAFAARSWQPPISPPAGFGFGGLGPAVQFDAEGDISTTLKPIGPGPYRYSVRPYGGMLSAPEAFPGTLGEAGIETRHTTTNAAGDLLMWSGGGNVVGFRPAPIYSVAFGPTSFTQVQSLSATTGALRHAAMTPAGATVAQTLKGNPTGVNPTSQTYVIFRPADPGAVFDESQKVELPPAPPDTGTEPLGIVADPGGRITTLYRSLPSLRVMQTSATGPGLPFGPATELVLSADPAQWQASAITRFAASYNGHAILVWGTDRTDQDDHKTEIWASRRAPGGSFGAREAVLDLDPGHGETDPDANHGPSGIAGGPSAPQLFPVALDSGAALLAFDEITEGDSCASPAMADVEQGALLVTSEAAGSWSSPTPLGPSGNLVHSRVEAIAAVGNSVALATAEVTRPAPCDDSSLSVAVSARAGQGTTLGAATGLGASGGLGGTGIAVNVAGDAALVLGTPRVLRVYEDPGTEPEPPGPEPEEPSNPTNPGGDSGSSSGGSATVPAANLPGNPARKPPETGPLGGLKPAQSFRANAQARRPSFKLNAYCAAEARATCTISIRAATKPAPLKPAATKVAPGKTKTLKAYLTPAGTALLQQVGSLRAKIRVVVKAGAAGSSSTRTITVKKG